MIYFDNSATTFPKPKCVYDALDYANRNLAFNAGRGQYNKAVEASNYIIEARKQIASFINCDYKSVTFLSSATESLNLIINGLKIVDGDNIYISPFEHNAIVRPLYNLQRKIKFNIFIIPFLKESWNVDFVKLKNMFAANNPKAILLSSVSNVTGFKLPYSLIFGEAKKYSSINILDCAQSYGVIDTNKKDVDFIVFAGHKTLYSSFGIAGFINLTNYELEIVKSGGNGSDSLNHYMPDKYYERYESGSPNIVAIYGLIESCKWLKENDVFIKEEELTKYLIEQLRKNLKIEIYAPDNADLFGIVSINVEGYTPDDVASILSDEFDICTRSGFHCSPFVHEFIGSLSKSGTVRISLGAFNTKEEIDILIEALNTL